MNVLEEARRVSFLTQEDMARRLGLSIMTIVNREKSEPETLSIKKLLEWSKVCNQDGQDRIKSWAVSFFA